LTNIRNFQGVFFFSFFQFHAVAATPVIHPQEELAKFGYKSERKIENFKSVAIFLQPSGTYCLKMVISGKKTNSCDLFE
jgi:hypothetical protein